MAIYAQRTAFRSSAQFPDFKVTSQLLPGQILVFDSKLRAFINKDSSVLIGAAPAGPPPVGAVTSGSNLGSGAEVFSDIVLDDIQFRTLVGDDGITITQTTEELFISNDVLTESCISVPSDFKIEIDNDNNTDCSARFELFTNKYAAQTILTPITYVASALDITTVTDPGGTDPGKFVSATADFGALGFEAGMCLRSTGTNEQDGVFEIASIDTTTNTNDTITITIHFPDDTDDGAQPATTLEAVFFKFLTNKIFRSAGADFVAAGFVPGQSIQISGTPAGAIGDVLATYLTGETIVIDGTPVTLSTGGTVSVAGADGATFTKNDDIVINGSSVILSTGTTVADAVTDITAATIPGVSAADVGGALVITMTAPPTTALTLAEGAGTALADLGFTAGSFPLRSTVANAITDITAATIAGITAVDVGGALRVLSTNQSIILVEGSGTALADLGLTAGTFTDGGILDDTYTIASLTTEEITIVEIFSGTFPLCVVGNIDIHTTPSETLSTGWWVNECGEMQAKDTLIMGDLTVTGDTNIDGDLFLGSFNILDIINASAPVSATDGILVQTSPGVLEGREIDVTTGLTIIREDGISGNPEIGVEDFDLTFTGDVTGTDTVVTLTNTSIALTLASVTAPGTFNEVTVDAKGRVTSGTNVSLTFQPLDADLTTLSGGLSSPGYVVWNGSDFIDRILVGTADQITLTDPDALAGDTVISLADNPILPGISYVTLPRGFTGDRPGTGVDGMMRYNTTDDLFEGHVSGSWESFIQGSASDFLPTAGGTMTGDIVMNDNDITFTSGLVDGRDVSADGIVLDAINSGTGIKVQTGVGTFVNREIEGGPDGPIEVTDGDGVSGNISIDLVIPPTTELEIGQVVDDNNDYLLMHDTSQNGLRKVNPAFINKRDAFRYFMAQI